MWRGTATDAHQAVVDESNALDVMRARLHLFGRWYPQWLDTHLTAYAHQAFDSNCLGALMPPGAVAGNTMRCVVLGCVMCCCSGALSVQWRRGRGTTMPCSAAATLASAAHAGTPLPLEEFNRYAVIVDADGNAWSDRFRLITLFNTPILKQASNLTGEQCKLRHGFTCACYRGGRIIESRVFA